MHQKAMHVLHALYESGYTGVHRNYTNVEGVEGGQERSRLVLFDVEKYLQK